MHFAINILTKTKIIVIVAKMEIKMKRCAKGAVGSVVLSAGVALKLAKWGLSVSEIVLNGADNLANSFVKTPSLGIGKGAISDIKKQVSKFSDICLKKGREMW